MKCITLLSILAVGSAAAGEPVYIDKNPIMPPAPNLYSWFAGASVGYLTNADEEMYSGHLGVDLPNQLGGWDQAIYLEVGYINPDDSRNFDFNRITGMSKYQYDYDRVKFDFDIVPVTLNYKLERAVGCVNFYISAGAGVAFLDADAKIGPFSDSDDDTVFYAQLATGFVYNVNPSFELFAGARLVYFDDPDFNFFSNEVDFDVDLDDIPGSDVDNTDVAIEVGARITF
jgi:hypothetical protein